MKAQIHIIGSASTGLAHAVSVETLVTLEVPINHN
jgi:hypothetical protein